MLPLILLLLLLTNDDISTKKPFDCHPLPILLHPHTVCCIVHRPITCVGIQ